MHHGDVKALVIAAARPGAPADARHLAPGDRSCAERGALDRRRRRQVEHLVDPCQLVGGVFGKTVIAGARPVGTEGAADEQPAVLTLADMEVGTGDNGSQEWAARVAPHQQAVARLHLQRHRHGVEKARRRVAGLPEPVIGKLRAAMLAIRGEPSWPELQSLLGVSDITALDPARYALMASVSA